MNLKISILILTITGMAISATHNTKMIIRLARHGARSPTSGDKLGHGWIGVKNDYDYGELIPAGYRQHYVSGVELKLRYRKLLMSRLEPDEYFLRSSSKERTF